MNVGFIGLGHMGGPMSRNVLAAGHDLLVHDLRRETAAGLEAAGAAWASTPRDTAAGRDVVITSLPAPAHVEQVLLGPDGLLSGLEPGSVWIDMSTSVPAVADRVRALARDVAILDAPVAGAAAGAEAGTLQIFVGGDWPCSSAATTTIRSRSPWPARTWDSRWTWPGPWGCPSS